jgi:hypothetical protein
MKNQDDQRNELLRTAAEKVALRTGLLRRCPTHGELFDPGQHDLQGARMMVAYLINQSDPLVAPFAGDSGALNDILKTICKSYSPACPQCPSA